MKKRKLTLLKLGTFLFGISILLFNCEKTEIDEIQQQNYFSKIDFKKFTEDVNNYEKIGYLKQSRNNEENRFEIITNDIIRIKKEESATYTFKVINTKDNITNHFFNLIVQTNVNGEITKTYLLEYQPNQEWLNDSSKPFYGKVKSVEDSGINLDNLFSRTRRRCITAVRGYWHCSFGNSGDNHAPGKCNARSSEFIVEYDFDVCEDSSGDGAAEVSDSSSGPGGGGGASSSGNSLPVDTSISPPPCRNEKVQNPTTKECECPDGKVEDSSGNCVDDDDCNTSKADLKKVFTNISDTNASTLAFVINDKGEDFGIDSKEKLQHFLAQAGHEVGEFANGLSATESLYYTSESRLKKVFKKYFWQNSSDTINKRNPADYLKNSSKVANYVYANRMTNGNEASEEGYKYRGRGIFQLTGKANYTAFKTWYNNKYDPDKDFTTSPSLLTSNDTISIISALWFYKTSVLDKITPTIDSTTTVKKVTKKVNGGKNGLTHRKTIFNKAKDSITCK